MSFGHDEIVQMAGKKRGNQVPLKRVELIESTPWRDKIISQTIRVMLRLLFDTFMTKRIFNSQII
jgi:hypothetical protein